MAHWDFWGWLAYTSLWIGGIILFADGGLRMASDVAPRHPRLSQIIHSRSWAFSPLIFVVLGTLILVAKEFDFLPNLGGHGTWSLYILGGFALLFMAWVANLLREPLQSKRELANPSVHFPTPNWHEPLRPIVSKHFKNEAVELDGKSFIGCIFENVTFVYQGTMPAQFTNCSMPNHGGRYIFRSGNPVVQVTAGIISSLRMSAGMPETVQLTYE